MVVVGGAGRSESEWSAFGRAKGGNALNARALSCGEDLDTLNG